ncbi:MAG: pyridoxal phosphate-dependent aminotransferase [Planctomycetota bacterium]|nr:pyridoxal phosphate-dependent aminotransferase [Planctomycetota bacterium]MDA1106137.1 pyridoxal phosphate-dependent aminotransferase [Planctomycetota bacterium]
MARKLAAMPTLAVPTTVPVNSSIARMKESATLAVTARAAALKAQGVDVVGFGVGEPDFDTPASIKAAAIRALESGRTKYEPTPGAADARKAIANKLQVENGIPVQWQQVSITCGAKYAVAMALHMLIEPGRGDEVILPTPAWVSYRPLIELAGGRCIEVAGSFENGFRVTAEQVAAVITPRTVGILLNSPSNPCGIAYPVEELRAIADVVADHPQVCVLSDEIYEKLVYPEVTPGLSHWSPGSDPRLSDRTITVNGMSKAYAMTGWRLGYIATPANGGGWMKEFIKLQGQQTNNVSSFAMPAIVEALTNGAADVERMREAFARRAILVHQRLVTMPRLSSVASNGAFYSFPDISACMGLTTPRGRLIDGAQAFAEALLDEHAVAVVPGEDFGECARRNIRISFACGEPQIEKGLSRLGEFVTSLR